MIHHPEIDKYKGLLMMLDNGTIVILVNCTIASRTVTVRSGFLGLKETFKEEYVVNEVTFNAGNKVATYSYLGHSIDGFVCFLKGARERYLKMSRDLHKFGYVVRKK